MRNLFFIAVLSLTTINGKAQIVGIGIQPKYQFSRQININETVEKRFARSIDALLSSPGIDLFLDYQFNDNWVSRSKVGYERKGFVADYSYVAVNDRAHIFDYVALDLNIIRLWDEKKSVQLYNYVGLSTGYLVHMKTAESALWGPAEIDPSFPNNYDDYSRLNFGYTLGFGMSFKNVLWLEIERNGDIIAPYKSDVLRIRNVASSVNVGINLLTLFKKP